MNQAKIEGVRISRGQAGTRCPYCHDALAVEERQERCGDCLAGHHPECFTAHGGCSACNNRLEPAEDVRVVWEGGLQMLTTPFTSAFLWEPSSGGRGLINFAYLLLAIALIALAVPGIVSFSVGLPLTRLAFGFLLIAFGPLMLRLRRRGGQRSGHISMDNRGLALGAPWGRAAQRPWNEIKGFSMTRRFGQSEVYLEGRGRERLASFKDEAAAERLCAELRRGLVRFGGGGA